MINVGTVVLVDDNEADNFFHKLAIEAATKVKVGQVVDFTEPEAGLEWLSQPGTAADVIFLDINMPRMNGWEFLKAFYQLPDPVKKTVVIMMLTTSPDPHDKERAGVEQSVAEFLNKPLTTETFESLVQRYYASE